MGAMIASDRVVEPFLEGDDARSSTASRSAATRCARAVALANIDVFEQRGHPRATCASNEGAFRAMLESLRDIPIVGDVRGAGYFHAIELVKDQRHEGVASRRGVRDAAARLPLAASCSGAA